VPTLNLHGSIEGTWTQQSRVRAENMVNVEVDKLKDLVNEEK